MFLFTLAVLLGSAALVFGQLPSVRLLNVTPAGGRAGSTIEVTVSGQDLGDSNQLQFSHRGITVTAKPTNRFEVAVAKDVPPGTYDVRVVGKHGASNPRAFAIGVMAEVAESKNGSDAPQAVSLESTVNGRTDANTVDYFRFAAKNGQRVLMRCDARELDSKLEPVLALYDGAGREVNHSRSGGLLDHTANEDGEFTVRLHDITYRGGPEFFYRLSIGTFPHIDYLLPLDGGSGKAKFAVFGRNIPGGKIVDANAKPALERIEVELAENDPALTKPLTTMPAQAALDLFEYRIRNERGVSDPALIRFPRAPVNNEQEPNNTRATAKKITLPCEVAGQLYPNGDRDWFSFDAKKGDVYWIEVVSHRLGLPTDPFILVQRVTTNGATDVLELNDSEPNAGGFEFNTTHRDPSGKFEAKEDGTHWVQVRDLFTQPRRNPALVYQLVIRKPAPDFRLVTLPQALPAKKDAKDIPLVPLALHRGETVALKVFVSRRDGFDGEIAVVADGLSPGISAAPCRIESGKNSGLLFLTAADDAMASDGGVMVHATATIGGTNMSRVAVPATVVWGTADPAAESVVSRVSANGTLSLREEAVPVRVHAASNIVETVAGKTVKINFLIDRGESSTGPVKLKPFGLAALDSVPELEVDAKATNLVLQIDLKEKKVSAGTHVFALQVSPQGKPVSDSSKKPKDAPPAFYSTPVVLQVNPAPVAQTNSPAK